MSTAATPGGPAGTGGDGPRDRLADRVRAAVQAVPGVVALHGGAFGEIATYLPGRVVAGVRQRPDAVHVHVVLAEGVDLRATAAAVHAAAAAAAGGPVHVHVDDLAPAGAGHPEEL